MDIHPSVRVLTYSHHADICVNTAYKHIAFFGQISLGPMDAFFCLVQKLLQQPDSISMNSVFFSPYGQIDRLIKD